MVDLEYLSLCSTVQLRRPFAKQVTVERERTNAVRPPVTSPLLLRMTIVAPARQSMRLVDHRCINTYGPHHETSTHTAAHSIATPLLISEFDYETLRHVTRS
jgi:hypothetical protein